MCLRQSMAWETQVVTNCCAISLIFTGVRFNNITSGGFLLAILSFFKIVFPK
jgi:hypothetical protein